MNRDEAYPVAISPHFALSTVDMDGLMFGQIQMELARRSLDGVVSDGGHELAVLDDVRSSALGQGVEGGEALGRGRAMLDVGQMARFDSFKRATGLKILQRQCAVHCLLLGVTDAQVVVVDHGQAEVMGIVGQRNWKISIPEESLT